MDIEKSIIVFSDPKTAYLFGLGQAIKSLCSKPESYVNTDAIKLIKVTIYLLTLKMCLISIIRGF